MLPRDLKVDLALRLDVPRARVTVGVRQRATAPLGVLGLRGRVRVRVWLGLEYFSFDGSDLRGRLRSTRVPSVGRL